MLTPQAFQRRVDVQQGVPQPVAQPGGVGGEVVVVAGEDGQPGEGLIIGADPAQGVRHRASRVGDDVGVSGVGLPFAGVQVGDAAHRQPRQVADVEAQGAGDCDRQRADRSRLVDDHQDPAVLAKPAEDGGQSLLVVG